MQEAVEPNIKNVYLLGGVFVLIAPPIYATMNSPSRCDWGFSPKDSAFPSSSGRDSEEHMIYGQYYPGFATPRDISQLPISHTTAIVPDFFRFPRGILALDPLIQHPPRPLEPPFTGSFSPPGTTIVGPPFPSHQAVVRATSPTLAIGFCAPSGASIPPGSACAPPPHLQWSPKSLYPYPYGPRPGMSTVTVPSGQFVTQPQLLSVSRFGPAGHVQPPGTALVSRYSTAATPENVHTSSLKPSVLCPICGNESRRSQERDRHMLSHLPCWIACSLDGCRWRGIVAITSKSIYGTNIRLSC
ncbi:hypothetical protein EI94DRAFT_522680 [Lactarius quietus]|nr:hypothetical protein EI94DRAFT_522680 [Lactarius quietus]